MVYLDSVVLVGFMVHSFCSILFVVKWPTNRSKQVPQEERKQIKIRVTADQHKLLGVAAMMEGKSMAEFISDSAIDAARRLLDDAGAVKALVKAAAPQDAKPKASPKAKK